MMFKRPLLFALLMTAALPGLAQDKQPVMGVQAAALDPEDIGIVKYVFEASPPVGKVMVLRATTTYKGRSTVRVFETVHYTNGKPARETVMVLDPSRFPFREDFDKPSSARVRAQSGEAELTGKHLTAWSGGGSTVLLSFSDDKGNEEHIAYKCFIEDYASAKARLPTLPEAKEDEGWGFNVEVPQR